MLPTLTAETLQSTVFFDPPVRTRRIAIIGFGDETRDEAPFDDPECEIWILNMLHGAVPRWDRLFELHDRETIEQESDSKEELRKAERGGKRHIDVLRSELTRPIYMVEQWADIPCCVKFPVDRVTAIFAKRCYKLARQPYFTSSFAYMLAFAALKIVDQRADPHIPEFGEEIHVCGVEMMSGEEYAYQRSNAEFVAGWVMGLGIQLFVPDRSALLESDGMYGYAHANESLELLTRLRAWAQDQRKHQIAKRDEAAERRERARADWNTYDGASQMADKMVGQLLYLCRAGRFDGIVVRNARRGHHGGGGGLQSLCVRSRVRTSCM